MRGGSELRLRLVGAALALFAAAVHFALAVADLIPGESTRGPAFAAMGVGLLGCAAVLILGQRDFYLPVVVYAGSLLLAYLGTRDERPIELIGITTKVAETATLIITILLIRAAPAPLGG